MKISSSKSRKGPSVKQRKYYPVAPDVILKASFEANGRNLGDCRNISYNEMWDRYGAIYKNEYAEWELKRIHDRWRRIVADL